MVNMPPYDPDLHDIGIGQGDTIYGFMLMGGNDGAGAGRQDNAPAVAQSAEGESRDDSIQTESFYAPNDWEGGAGSLRHVAIDQFGHGIGHGESAGQYTPPKVSLAGVGSGTSWIVSGKSSVGSAEASPNANAQLYTYTNGFIHPAGGTGTAISANPREYPAVLGSGVILWANENLELERYGGGAYTPPTGSIEAVARFAKWCVALGHEEYNGAIGETGVGDITHVVTASTTGYTSSVSWSQPTADDSLLLMVVTSSIGGGTFKGPIDTDWQELAIVDDSASAPVYVYYIEGADSRAGAEGVSWSSAGKHIISLIEIPGLAKVGTLDEISFSTGAAGTAVSAGTTATTDVANELAIFIGATDVATTFTPPAGYTEELDTSGTLLTLTVASKLLTATGSQSATATAAAAGDWTGLLITFRGNTPTAITETWDTFAIWYSSNEGISWDRIPMEGVSGIGRVISAEAGINNLWFTTTDGLYRVQLSESRDADGSIIAAGIAHVDKWTVPEDVSIVGTRIGFAQGAVFTNLGKTIRRYVIGGTEEDRAVFPTDGWSGPVDAVRGLTTAQGHMFFSSGGFLYHYNGRGFFPVQQEEVANEFDHLFFHAGYLYYAGGKKRYYYGDLGVRPDIIDDTATYVTTGYLLQGGFDYGKVSARKLGRRFETKSLFTAAEDSGNIALYYVIDPVIDPIREGGAAASTDWTLIGTHDVTDGYTKRHVLPEPIVGTRFYYRVVITPGANGYPRFQGFSSFMRAMMESFKRFPLTIDIGTDTIDANKNYLYDSVDDVHEALTYLLNIREASRDGDEQIWFRLAYPDGTRYICTAEAYQDVTLGRFRNHATGYMVAFTAQEVP